MKPSIRSILVCNLIALTTASAQTTTTKPIRGWASLGVGGANVGGLRALGVDAELTATRGHLLVAGRLGGGLSGTPANSAFSKDETSIGSGALMIGARTLHSGAFATGAIGIAGAVRSRDTSSCESCGTGTITEPKAHGLALEGGLHAAALLLGLGVRAFAIVGAGRANYSSLALSLDVGWLGNW